MGAVREPARLQANGSKLSPLSVLPIIVADTGGDVGDQASFWIDAPVGTVDQPGQTGRRTDLISNALRSGPA